MVPTFSDAGTIDNTTGCGPLTTLWLGGLNNPMALLTALKQEKAMILQCPVDQVQEFLPLADEYDNVIYFLYLLSILLMLSFECEKA